MNIDHRRTFDATRCDWPEAVVATFAVVGSTDRAFQRARVSFHPNLFVDVRSQLDNKLGAVAVYTDEVRLLPRRRSLESPRVQAQRWGGTAGLEAAEAFEVARMAL